MGSEADDGAMTQKPGRSKPAGPKRPAPVTKASAPVSGAPVSGAPVDATGSETSGASAMPVRKSDLLARVGALSKAKKKDVKEVVEATLLVLGEALARGEDLNLPPLGKAKVGRQKGVNGGDLYIIKLRRGAAKAGAATEPLADEAE